MSAPILYSFDQGDLRRMPPRTPQSHKGTYGRAVLLCGSRGMAGASYLCAKAAYRTGAGLVEIVTPEENRVILQTLLPEAIVTTYTDDPADRKKLLQALARADAFAVGCGLGTSSLSLDLLRLSLEHVAVPTVIDADALNLISRHPDLFSHLSGKIVTPHPMEMSRLCGTPAPEIAGNVTRFAQNFALTHDCVCVLKDHRTAVADGSERIYQNMSGNSGMATGGSGDVLTGILVGILAQKKTVAPTELRDVAALGVYLHGLCGDDAASHLGEYALMASDLVDALPRVLRSLTENS